MSEPTTTTTKKKMLCRRPGAALAHVLLSPGHAAALGGVVDVGWRVASRVAVGQVWASNHCGDRDANVRQHREVVAVEADRAELQTMSGRLASLEY